MLGSRYFVFSIVLTLICPISGSAQARPGCAADSAFAMLDFWVGDWNVYQDTTLVGTNRIEKVLSGCAVIEHWRAVGGAEGKSLFYYQPATAQWKQVWVTENPASPGSVKEKVLTEKLAGGGVRFQGEIPLRGGATYLDRTTLTPLPDGRVRQLIEIARDGKTWETTFDAVYAPSQRRAR